MRQVKPGPIFQYVQYVQFNKENNMSDLVYMGVKMAPDLKQKAEDHARSQTVSTSAVVRQALAAYLEEVPMPKPAPASVDASTPDQDKRS